MIIPHRQSFNIFYNRSSHSQSVWIGITQGDGKCSVPFFSQSSCLQSPPHQKAHSPSKEQRVQTSNQASTWGCTRGVDCLWGCLPTCPGFDSFLSVTCLQFVTCSSLPGAPESSIQGQEGRKEIREWTTAPKVL